MKFRDRVYGEIKITEPALVEIIKSPSLRRLKGIDQIGYPKTFFNQTTYSRFEHSLGVCWLLKKYGASLEEQIAGLIHDISHSAFSHSIDYILKGGSQKQHNHQDNIFKSFLRKTEIPLILKKYGYSLARITNDNNFLLKETDLPQLCADRIDYSLRNALIYRQIKKARPFLVDLIVVGNKWVFKSKQAALRFAKLFKLLNRRYYSSFKSAAMFKTVGDYLRYALARGYVRLADLYTTDKKLLNRVKKFHNCDPQLLFLFRKMTNRGLTKRTAAGKGVVVYCKSRIADPLFLNRKKITTLSSISPKWKQIIKEELKPKKYFLNR